MKSPVKASPQPLASPAPHAVDATPLLNRGHWRSLELLENTPAVLTTTDAPIDIAEALEKAAVHMPTEAELTLLAGEPWLPPTPEQNFDELPLATLPDVARMLRPRGSRSQRRIELVTLVVDQKPALLLDRGEPVQPTLGHGPAPRSAVRIFSSAEARDRHLEHLWRYGGFETE